MLDPERLRGEDDAHDGSTIESRDSEVLARPSRPLCDHASDVPDGLGKLVQHGGTQIGNGQGELASVTEVSQCFFCPVTGFSTRSEPARARLGERSSSSLGAARGVVAVSRPVEPPPRGGSFRLSPKPTASWDAHSVSPRAAPGELRPARNRGLRAPLGRSCRRECEAAPQ